MSTFLSRGIDYLGDLGAKLRDLRGDRTLAYELIQNADDARDATWMCFNVRHDALIVDNDGTFSDCGKTQEADCPWKEDKLHAHRCDFHRFQRMVISEAKPAQQELLGSDSSRSTRSRIAPRLFQSVSTGSCEERQGRIADQKFVQGV